MRAAVFTKLTLGAAVVVAAAFFTPVSAAPFAPQTTRVDVAATDSGLVTQVHHNHHRHHRHFPYISLYLDGNHVGYSCRSWRHRCADRFGWGTGAYERCLWRHGC